MDKSPKTVSWAHTTNIYEVNTRQYTAEGTFNAFLKELPRLKDMGVQTLWFMPITPIAKKNSKGVLGSPYACSDYTSINPELGSLEDFKSLVKEAHRQSFKVMIDWVANHTGWDHVWTVSHPDYYKHDHSTNDFKIASGMDDIIELDYHNPALRKAMIEAMKFWVTEADIDGYRCDLASWVQVDFWEEARPQVDAVKHLMWLGEFDELESPDYGKTFDASYSWKWMHQTEHFFKQRLPLEVLESLLQRYTAIGDNSMRAWFTSNHDENSWNGTEYEKYGNMAHALAVFSITWNGVPLIYGGQEIPLLAKRLAFFEKDVIPWTGKYELHDFYKLLLNLHANHPALKGGDPESTTQLINTSAPGKAYVYLRKNGAREILVLLNLSYESNLDITLNDLEVNGSFVNVFTNVQLDLNKQRSFHMQAWDYVVLAK